MHQQPCASLHKGDGTPCLLAAVIAATTLVATPSLLSPTVWGGNLDKDRCRVTEWCIQQAQPTGVVHNPCNLLCGDAGYQCCKNSSGQACTSWPVRPNCSWKCPNGNCKPAHKSRWTFKQGNKQCFTKPNRLQGVTLLLSNYIVLATCSRFAQLVLEHHDGCAGLPHCRLPTVKSRKISCCATGQSGRPDLSCLSPLLQRQ